MRAIHFGAGNIGRGFIGLLLSQAGYSVTFVDVTEALVKLLNERQRYEVQLANATGERVVVENVDALVGSNLLAVSEAILKADLITTAVGVNILKHIAPAIAEGIKQRAKLNLPPLTIIACENAIRATSQLRREISLHLTAELVEALDHFATFPDAAVDRIVPLQQHDDPLFVTVEPFYEWTIESRDWPQQLPFIKGVHYVELLEPYIERKLFTVNTGHATTAYLGQLKGYRTIQEAMQDKTLVAEVMQVLRETGDALIAQYRFNSEEHELYIGQIIERFGNPYLSDDIKRVGRSPIRKLSPQDRFVRPALLALQHGIDVQALPKVMAAALFFHDEEDQEALELKGHLQQHGVDSTITKYTGIHLEHPLHYKIKAHYELLNNKSS